MSGVQRDFATSVLQLIFNAAAIANIADDAGSDPLTDIQVSLHTADPISSSDQTNNECAYTSYARVAVPRTTDGFSVATGTLAPVADIAFPKCTGGSETATHIGFGTAGSGAGALMISGTLSPVILISTGVVPTLGSSSTITLR